MAAQSVWHMVHGCVGQRAVLEDPPMSSSSVIYPAQETNNRAVHLARRDAFFTRALELLCIPFHHIDLKQRLLNVTQVLACVQMSRKHASFAAQYEGAIPREDEFIHFLDLKIENIDSLAAMLQHQAHLEEETNVLSSFLGITREQSLLPAFHYQRRAEDILQGLWHLISQAQSPYHNLRKACIDSLNDSDKERYERALTHFQQEAQEKHRAPPPPLTSPQPHERGRVATG